MVSGRSNLVDLDVEIRRVTRHEDGAPNAYLLYDGSREVWVPASEVEDNSDGTVTMPLWLATDKGLV